MKTAYLSTFYPYRGGIAQFNANLLKEFQKLGDAKAFTFTRQYPNLLFPGSSQMVSTEDKTEHVDSIRLLDTVNPFSYITTANHIKSFAPDVVITKFWMPFFAPALGYVTGSLKKHGAKSIAILDNVIPHERRPGDLSLIKYFVKRNNGFVVMSSSVKNDLLSINPNAHYIFHEHPLYDHFGKSIDIIEARKALNIPADKKVLLFFGFIRKYKGLMLLLEALTKLDDSYFCIIAGEPYESFDDYSSFINNHNLNNRVKLLVRYIADNEVANIFSASNLCVLPYKSATQSGIIGICYNFNLPVLATDVGSLKEMIEPHNTGIVIKEHNIDMLAEAINTYFANGKEQEFRNSIEKYKEKASWANLAKSIENFSREL